MKIKLYSGDQYDLSDLISIDDKEYFKLGYSANFYYFIKCLELNSKFEKIIVKARLKLKIPEEGFDIDTYLKITGKPKYSEKNKLEAERYFNVDDFELRRKIFSNIESKLNTSSYISSLGIEHIVYANFTIAYPERIQHYLNEFSEDEVDITYDCLDISISEPVTKNELVKYIERNWNNIEINLSKLNTPHRTYISRRDLRIYELRMDGLTHKEIVEKVIDEYQIDNYDGKINEDTIKTAYARAKSKIDCLIR